MAPEEMPAEGEAGDDDDAGGVMIVQAEELSMGLLFSSTAWSSSVVASSNAGHSVNSPASRLIMR